MVVRLMCGVFGHLSVLLVGISDIMLEPLDWSSLNSSPAVS